MIAVIERPAVIRQILDHLGLASTPPSLRAPPDQPDGGAAERPREWAYEPLFDLPVRRPSHADRRPPHPRSALPAGRQVLV